jgi:hypothetical protein
MSPEPEPWQTNAARPAMVIEKPGGTVTVSALGCEQFRVEAPGHDSQVEGYAEARALVHKLA